MVSSMISAVLAFVVLSVVRSETCVSPSVTTDTYTSKSIALSTETAYLAEFSVACKDDVKGTPLLIDCSLWWFVIKYNLN